MSGSSPYGQNPYGQDPNGQNPYGQDPAAAQQPYGSSAAPGSAPQNPYGVPAQGSGQAPAPAWNAQPGHQQGQQPGAWQQPDVAQGGWPGQAVPAAGMPTPARPHSLTTAFWLILSAGLVLLGTTLLGILAANTPEGRAAAQQAMDEALAQADLPPDQAAQVQSMMGGLLPSVLIGMAVFSILAFLLYLLIALKIRGGSRAARTVGTVLAALSVLMLLGNLAIGAFNPFELLWVGLGVAGLVFAYRRDATEYMRLKAWERVAR